MDEIKDKLTNPSKETMQDKRGHFWCYLSLTLIILLVASILYFITSKGIATFVQDKVNIGDFLTGKDWDPAAGAKKVGALPMITTSFAVTVLSALTATPFALAIGLFTTQYAKNGARFLQPVIELLVGIPSVVYGYVGLTVIVPFIRKVFGGTGLGFFPERSYCSSWFCRRSRR